MKKKISIIGLGYVGLPLAIEFAKIARVIGFDNNKQRVEKLNNKIDENLQVKKKDFLHKNSLKFSTNKNDLTNSDYFIVTVPTPIDHKNKPDLKHLIESTKIIGKYLKKNSIVVYESTVYPGCTEEVCVPILQKISGLKFNKDFFCGYSPERINVGDNRFTLKKIKKVTSGSTPSSAKKIDALYKKIITAGTHLASSIKVAEASKVIENTQRDLNIGLVNELSIIFNLLKIDTKEVIEAAATKWNFIPYSPGLVGGHCIGVDPYYLTYKAEKLGYKPKIILSSRKLNNSMSSHVAKRFTYLMKSKKIKVNKSKVLIFGITFKKNCTDIRNTKVLDLIKHLRLKKVEVDVYDPWADLNSLKGKMNFKFISNLTEKKNYDGAILAVSHDCFSKFQKKGFGKLLKKKSVVYDVKSFLDKSLSDERL